MPFWITNPLHGVMPVYSSGEVDRHKAMGWTLLNHGESPNLPPKRAAVPMLHERDALVKAESLNELRDESAPEKRQPGRPPKAK